MNDEKIRAHLTEYLMRMAVRPKAILQEVRVHYGNAIADVVSVHDNPHCYEIKGSTDNIYKALKQSFFYEQAFKKMTLVTTENYASAAIRIMPSHWGVMIARLKGERLAFVYERKATINKNFNKEIALHTLWKSELLESTQARDVKGAKNLNRDQLISLIASSRSEGELLKFIGEKLSERGSIKRSL